MTLNILVPTDFSNDAYNALHYATQLYKHQKCVFHILHAYDHQSHFKEDFRTSGTTKNLENFLNDRTNECLLETYHKIIADTEKNSFHQFATVSKNDSFDKAVKDYMAHHKIDLVVMGTKGETGAADIFVGGNTIQMVKRKLHCPILCIPKQLDYRPIFHLGYITSFKHSHEQVSLSILKSLASYHAASLHIIHICDTDTVVASQEKNKAELSRYFKAISVHFHTIPFEKSKAKTLGKFAKSEKLDVLAMCYYPHYFLDKLFREPVVLDLSIYTEIPLLVLPSQE